MLSLLRWGGGSLPQSVQKCLDDQGLLYLWSKIKGNLQLKVDKLEGFGLSSNDFSSAEKAKLQAYPEYSALNADITNRLSTLQTAMDSKMTNVYKFKGSVATYANLPSSGLTAGDVYNVQENEMNYAWTGSTWDQLGSSQINLQTITNAEIDQMIANAGTGSGGESQILPQMVKYIHYTGTGSGTFNLANPFGDKLRRVEIQMIRAASDLKRPVSVNFSVIIPPGMTAAGSFFAPSFMNYAVYDGAPEYSTAITAYTYFHQHVVSLNSDKSVITFKELYSEYITAKSSDSTSGTVVAHGMVQSSNYRQTAYKSDLNEYECQYVAALYGDAETEMVTNSASNPVCTQGPGWAS